MKIRGVVFLAIVALTSAAGCASGTAIKAGDGIASPSPTIGDCRNRGSYNRAANLCVSGGGP